MGRRIFLLLIRDNYRIQKFTAQGQLPQQQWVLEGIGPLQFRYSLLALHSTLANNGRVFVVDSLTMRIIVFKS